VLAALLGLLGGTASQLQQAALWPQTVYMGFVLLAGVLYALKQSKLIASRFTASRFGSGLLPGLGISLALGVLAFGVTGLRSTHFLSGALAPSLEGRDITVVGVVAAMPQRHDAGLRFRLDVASATLQGAPVRVPPAIDLSWYAGVLTGAEGANELQRQPAALQPGERWQMTVRLKAPHGNSNPHGFDYELWAWEQGVQATGYVRAGPKDAPPQRLASTWQHPVEQARQWVRERIEARVADRNQAGLIAALVVGDQNAIERADWDVFRATGVAHLMSISGLHITMFAWAAALVIGWSWRRSSRLCAWRPAPMAALVGGVMLAGAYALFSGWGVPAQRTVLMLATVACLRASGRQWPWPQVWLLAGAVVVAADPWALLQAGFWLSFVAVGVLFATSATPGNPQPAGASGKSLVSRVAAPLRAMTHQQGVITLALTPLTLLLFGQASAVGLLANALAIPWVTLVLTPLAMLGVLIAPLWNLAAGAVAALLWFLQWLASWPFASVSLAQAPLWAGAAGVLGGGLLAMPLPRSVRFLGVPLLLPVLLWQAPRPDVGQFQLLAADVGQGNAVIVQTAMHALVYDAGPRLGRDTDAGHRVLVPLLRAFDTTVNKLVLSHRDSDHVGGAQAVLAMHPSAELLSSIEPEHELQAVRPATRCEAGQRWRWDGVDFEVLHPRAPDYEAGLKSNALSCTLRISNGAQSILLAGDIEQAQESRLVAEGVDIRANVMLVPHHGSKTSSSAAFLDAVQPQIALVQSGYRNRFGHPAQPVLVRYAERGIRVVDSPHCGAVTWHSLHPAQVSCHREQALRYWHHRVP
jgi:competence protein ComEC